METFRVGTGRTPVGTKLDFNVMGNPFGVKKLTEKQAIKIIKENGFRFKRVKDYGKTVVVKPLGDVYEFIESLREQKIFISDNGIAIK